MRHELIQPGLLGALLWLLAAPVLAQVSASVDKNPILQGETFTLTLHLAGAGGAEPDLSPLRQDFRILNQSQSSQIQVINGQTTRRTSWQILLAPRRLGELTIPAIAVGQERSSPIPIRVRPPDPQAGELPEVFIEFTAEKARVHLREQLILTTRLYLRGELVSGNLTEPQADNAVIETLGDQRESQSLRGNQRYRVIERRHALFPESSGTLTINGPVFSGELADRSQRQALFGFGTPTRSVYAAGKTLSINVDPAPPGQGRWLPASAVEFSESLSPANGPWRVGEPLTRTITVRVRGQLHTQLPALGELAPPGVQSYAEPPEENTTADQSGVIAVRTLRRAIIPAPAGDPASPAPR